jgi:hypothetical protein
MSFRNPSNPREMRTLLHAIYEPYAQGVINYPSSRIQGEVESLPERTIPIAQALVDAWRRIDADTAVHKALIRNVLKDPEASLFDEQGNPHRGIVVSRIGKNSLVEVVFTPATLEERLVLIETRDVGPRSAVEQYIENSRVELADGRIITGGGFDGEQTPDIEFSVPSGEKGLLGRVVHFDSRLSLAA